MVLLGFLEPDSKEGRAIIQQAGPLAGEEIRSQFSNAAPGFVGIWPGLPRVQGSGPRVRGLRFRA